MVSPISAEIVLAMASLGAKNQTAQEIRTALNLPDSPKEVETAFKTLLLKLRNNDFTLKAANKIYVTKLYPVVEEFLDTSKKVFNADIENIDFVKSTEAATTMNKWIEAQTNNKIQNLIESDALSSETVAVLLNALYFKASWETPFLDFSTIKKKFYKHGNLQVDIDTMINFDVQDTYRYTENAELKAQVLELLFKRGGASMVIVLPNEKNEFANLEKQIEKVLEIKDFSDEYVDIELPKFKIESTINFKQILQNLGLKKLFIPREADLSGIGGAPGELYVNKVIQKTFIDVSEKGVEAAATTFLGKYFLYYLFLMYIVALQML